MIISTYFNLKMAFWSALIVGVTYRVAIFAFAAFFSISNESGLPISPFLVATGVDFSFYLDSLRVYVTMTPGEILDRFIQFYVEPIENFLGPFVSGPVFPLMILAFDYRDGETVPLALLFLLLSICLFVAWLCWLRANGVGKFWLLIFALVPNPLWFMLNPSTDLPFALLFALFYLAYFRQSRRPMDTAFWLTALVLVLLTRPNGYSILLFVFLDHLLRLPGGGWRAVWSFVGMALLLIAFGLYLYPYFITEMQKTARTVYFFGLSQPEYVQGIYSQLPAWLNTPASWLSLIGAKALYFCGLRPSYAGVDWYVLLARAGIGLILLPGLCYVAFKGDRRHQLLLFCYLLPVFLGATQDRYNLAVQAILFLFGVKAIDGVWSRLRRPFAISGRPTA
jgi:hypothetical protein